MNHSEQTYPVDHILPKLQQALQQARAAVLQAPPGSGKTTRIPPALLNSDWLQGQRIIMLEPRRLAATNAAGFMARQRGERVGKTVGFSIRYEHKTSADTRIEVMTEGLLTRRMQTDPELSGIGLVIFDEFHERSLHADLAFALCRDIHQGLREDLRLLVMSATLDVAPLSALLNDCPVIETRGRSYPVTTRYLELEPAGSIADIAARGVRQALSEVEGDILVFLPGAGEIHRCQNLLAELSPKIQLCPLYGGLPFAEQERAILPGSQRRVVLATNVAETSLTIEGISAVVDSGWERRPRFDSARGLNFLETVRISQASADQRAGRAGRLAPGHCYRLWTEGAQGALLPFAPSEIRQADLAPLAFDLALWGVADASALAWLEPPASKPLDSARHLLVQLGALDQRGAVTKLGRAMADYPAHPRISRLLVAAVEQGCPGLGSELAALLSERDPFTAGDFSRSGGVGDLLDRLELLRRDRSAKSAVIRRAVRYWQNKTRAGREPLPDAVQLGSLLALAYPDRLARQRQQGSDRYLLRSGRGARLSPRAVVPKAEWLVVLDVAGKDSAEAEIRLAAELTPEAVESLFGRNLEWQHEVSWDEVGNRVVAREVRRIGAIVLQERPVKARLQDTAPALLELIRRQGLGCLPWSADALQLRARVALLQSSLPESHWPDWDDRVLLESLETWLLPFLGNIRSQEGLRRLDLSTALNNCLDWRQKQELERLAPLRFKVPSGSQIRLDYSQGDAPVLAVKLQEMFGQAATPRLAAGRVPVVIHLLSPAGRPLAVTQDLSSFWNEVYPEVQKEMKGRYPKHPWPDDPWSATATRKTKKVR